MKLQLLPLTLLASVLVGSSVLAVTPQDSITTPTQKSYETNEKTQELIDTYKASLREKSEEVRLQIEQNKEQIQEKIDEMKDRLVAGAMERYVTHLDKALDRLYEMKERITNSVGLAEDDKNLAYDQIDAVIAEVLAIKELVTDAETRDEFKSVAQQVRDVWMGYTNMYRKFAGLHVAGNFAEHVAKTKEVADRIENKVDSLAAQGIDVADMRVMLDGYKVAVELAESDVAEAKAMFMTIEQSQGNGENVYRQSMRVLGSAKVELYQAGKELRATMISIQQKVVPDNNE
jgi:hypothetical protein